MKNSLLMMAILFCNLSFSQGRLMLNNNPYVIITGGAFIVIENGNPNAITTTGGGNIISEAENNKIKWKIGSNTGSYTIPYTDNVNPTTGDNAQASDNGTKIPYTLNITAGATGGNYYEFSTYDGSSWDNQTYMPSMVTHMGQLLSPGSANHSDHAIDRFWLVNLVSYTTKPKVTHTFYYIDDEITATGNNLLEINLGAQRFNDSSGTWGDLWPVKATQNMVANFLVTPSITPSDFFTAWVLSDIITPLPIELINFEASCNLNRTVKISWTTNSEINNDFFTIEKSFNGIDFFSIGTVDGAGNSLTPIHYSFIDFDKSINALYRLKQTDFDGAFTYSNIKYVQCKESKENIYAYNENNQLIIKIESNNKEKTTINLIDASGRAIINSTMMTQKGMNTFTINENISTGMYLIRISSETINKAIRIYKN